MRPMHKVEMFRQQQRLYFICSMFMVPGIFNSINFYTDDILINVKNQTNCAYKNADNSRTDGEVVSKIFFPHDPKIK